MTRDTPPTHTHLCANKETASLSSFCLSAFQRPQFNSMMSLILYQRNLRLGYVTVPHWSLALCNFCRSCQMPAVQEERQRSRERAEGEAEYASSGHEDMPVERILEAELAVEPKTESYGDMNMENSVYTLPSPSSFHFLGGVGGDREVFRVPRHHRNLFFSQTNDPVTNICHAADKQLFTLVEWAKRIPHFSDLTLEDQVILLRAGETADHSCPEKVP